MSPCFCVSRGRREHLPIHSIPGKVARPIQRKENGFRGESRPSAIYVCTHYDPQKLINLHSPESMLTAMWQDTAVTECLDTCVLSLFSPQTKKTTRTRKSHARTCPLCLIRPVTTPAGGWRAWTVEVDEQPDVVSFRDARSYPYEDRHRPRRQHEGGPR